MSKRSVFFFAALLCIVTTYEVPYILTLAKTGWTPLPPVVNYPADQMLYFNLSNIQRASPTEVVNPWYGDLVPAVDVPHLRFPITFALFHLTRTIFPSWTVAMLVWAAIWAAATFAAAVFCVDSLFPDTNPLLAITAAFGLLVLESPLVYAADLRQLPSLTGLLELRLPFVRFAYPQVIVPLVLAYWGLQVRALKSGSKLNWVAMALLQFGVCAAFPYFLPVIAAGTVVTIVIVKCRNTEITLSWPTVFIYSAVCDVLDIGYLALARLGKSHGNVEFALQFRPEMVTATIKPYVVLLVIASGLAFYSRASLAARATVAGLALSNALFAFSDAFFPASALMSAHVNYLISLTTWLPLLVFVWAFLDRFNGRLLRAGLIIALVLIGAWESYVLYRANISVNQIQAGAVNELEKLSLTAKDLVIAPAQFSDDTSCWVPLISPAKSLFTRDAENILPADHIKGEQNLRQALYLEMRGINYGSLLSLTDTGTPLHRLNSIGLFAELEYMISPLVEDHQRARSLIRERLAPMLAQLDADPTFARKLVSGYERIVVIDNSSRPIFTPSAFSKWLEVESAYEHKGTKVWICHAKPGF